MERQWALASVVSIAMVALAGRGSTATRGDSGEGPRPSVPVVLEGFVLDADGTPAQGAVVTSSAGGRAITDALGRYRIEESVSVDARRVQVWAAAPDRRGWRSASVALPGHELVPLAPLVLGEASACQPTWTLLYGGVDEDLGPLAVYDDGSGPTLFTVAQTELDEPAQLQKWMGSSWSPVGLPLSDLVFALTVFDDGTGPALYAGGLFEHLEGSGQPLDKIGGGMAPAGPRQAEASSSGSSGH
jgi:hypothetical protein